MKRFVCFFTALCMMFLFPCQVFAAEIIYPEITMEFIESDKAIVVYTSDETIHYPPYGASARTHGNYPLYTKYQEVVIPSGGMMEVDSQVGNLLSVGSLLLSFAGHAEAMAVSAILSALGLVFSQNTYVQAKTYISYINYQKQGLARWVDETNFTEWVYSERQEFYKHVMGGFLDDMGHWNTYTEDYLKEPCNVREGYYYNNSIDWFKNKAYECAVAETIFLDIPA